MQSRHGKALSTSLLAHSLQMGTPTVGSCDIDLADHFPTMKELRFVGL